VGAVTDTGDYLGTPIPIIKYSNPSSYGRIPTRKSCRYENLKISAISYVFFRIFILLEIPGGRRTKTD